MGKLVICDHPLIQHKLTFIRDVRTNTKDFREHVDEVATLMAYEITRDIPLETITVQTPHYRDGKQSDFGKNAGAYSYSSCGFRYA